MDLDEDPYLIDSWEHYCRICILEDRKDLFKKSLDKYIWETNNAMDKVLIEFCNKIQGEIIAQELLRKKRFPNI